MHVTEEHFVHEFRAKSWTKQTSWNAQA